MIVWDVLPSIKAAITEELVNCGLTQQEIAKELGMAPSAVSQYISKKRGYKIVFEDDVKGSIQDLAQDIKEKRVEDLPARVCEICMQLREDEDKCGAHKDKQC